MFIEDIDPENSGMFRSGMVGILAKFGRAMGLDCPTPPKSVTDTSGMVKSTSIVKSAVGGCGTPSIGISTTTPDS
jgi:hypothetical protein